VRGEFGLPTRVHFTPFQRIVNVLEVFRDSSWKAPTAKQLEELLHDTAVKKLAPSLDPFGLATTDHDAPFQCSVSVRGMCGEPALTEPTAKQLEELTHEMLASPPACGPVIVDHDVPFQRSYTRCPDWFGSSGAEKPIAKQLVALTHEICASSVLRYGPFGLGSRDHVAPSRRSKRVCVPSGLGCGSYEPTAKQCVASGHDTLESCESNTPGGFALCAMTNPPAALAGVAPANPIPVRSNVATTTCVAVRTRPERSPICPDPR
jgi:hypothetical protein